MADRVRRCSLVGAFLPRAAVPLACASALAATSCFGGAARTADDGRAPPALAVEHVAPADDATRTTRSVVVVTIDGTRWQEIFLGVDAELARRAGMDASEIVSADRLLPNLYHRVIERGVAVGAPGFGAPMLASGPNFVSLPGYVELLSGRAGTCTSNDCAPVAFSTLLDDVRRVSDRPEDVALVSSWDTLERAAALDPTKIVVSAGRHHGSNRDLVAADAESRAILDAGAACGSAPGDGDYRPDAFTAPLALRYLRARAPRFLFVGLGDTDEYAHAGDYRAYLFALRRADLFLGEVLDTLDAMGEHGATTSLFVTADHGRARNFRDHGKGSPESSRTWLAATGGAIIPRGYVREATPRRLADVAPTIRGLLALPTEPTSGAAMAELLPIGGDSARRAAR